MQCSDVRPFSPLTGPVTANQQQGWKRETRSRGSEMGQGPKDLLQQRHPQRREGSDAFREFWGRGGARTPKKMAEEEKGRKKRFLLCSQES